mgnify:FL=1
MKKQNILLLLAVSVLTVVLSACDSGTVIPPKKIVGDSPATGSMLHVAVERQVGMAVNDYAYFLVRGYELKDAGTLVFKCPCYATNSIGFVVASISGETVELKFLPGADYNVGSSDVRK